MKKIVPIRPKNSAEFFGFIEQIGGRADLIEVWLDGWDDFLSESVDFRRIQTPLLAVCKGESENGNFRSLPASGAGNSAEKYQILKKFIDNGGKYIDLDITQNEPELIKKFPKANLWLSFHDFTGVPDLDVIFSEMKSFDPWLYKFAVTPTSEAELDTFLEFAAVFSKNLAKVPRSFSGVGGIFTTMGSFGAIGRQKILEKNFSWGGFYALDESHKTASGQPIL